MIRVVVMCYFVAVPIFSRLERDTERLAVVGDRYSDRSVCSSVPATLDALTRLAGFFYRALLDLAESHHLLLLRAAASARVSGDTEVGRANPNCSNSSHEVLPLLIEKLAPW